MKTTRVPQSPCPRCKGEISRATAANNGNEATPEPGDLSLCFSCGELLVFRGDLTIESAPASTLEDLPVQLATYVRKLRDDIRSRPKGDA